MTLRLIFLLLILSNITFAQETVQIKFKKPRDTLRRKTEDYIEGISVIVDSIKIDKDSLKQYALKIKVDESVTTLPATDYKINNPTFTLDKLENENLIFLTIKHDSTIDRDRLLVLKFELSKNGKVVTINSATQNQNLELTIEGVRAINNYNYLAYLGTNFDLVDGVKAQNLFFAAGMFVPPSNIEKRSFGFSLYLYGNRAMTVTDTSGRFSFPSQLVKLVDSVSNDTTTTVTTSSALRITNRVTDNLGAAFNLIFNLGWLSATDRKTQIYYSPHFEFIWRRTKVKTMYSDIKVDSTTSYKENISSRSLTPYTPSDHVVPYNTYDAYLGFIGAILNHTNERVSIRVQTSLGYKFSYTSLSRSEIVDGQFSRIVRVAFNARVWITEPVSGLTIGAEVANNLLKDHKPYYNVTLSKAISLSSLGAIFQPITGR